MLRSKSFVLISLLTFFGRVSNLETVGGMGDRERFVPSRGGFGSSYVADPAYGSHAQDAHQPQYYEQGGAAAPPQSSRKSPRKSAANNLDTSGLSLAEDNTIDNITDDGSILAWFSRQRKERARGD